MVQFIASWGLLVMKALLDLMVRFWKRHVLNPKLLADDTTTTTELGVP
jgi:hypothetical protein